MNPVNLNQSLDGIALLAAVLDMIVMADACASAYLALASFAVILAYL
jgi:hypothetical protein